ncbi:dynein heavy chain domain-containing protein 1 [Aplysia californica]|uniref:Dynein heavy chain domain-containing protein 1 n=1 Tax=Aplysia californica TaxID=6500 RepID=A0ABM1VT92_APLCA|nr:dynein heavy chain domain-containing protein 1 [Aplysia californica]
MASKVESGLSDGTKLPSVMIGRSCLVSPPSSVKPTQMSPKEIASNWCSELRNRITENIECHEDVNEDDVMLLKQELIGVFITALQQDSRPQWQVFVEILTLLEPFKSLFDYFETRAELHHYLERVLQHVHLHKERLFDLQIEAVLEKIFPEEISLLKGKEPVCVRNYCSAPPPVLSLSIPSPAKLPSALQQPLPHQYPGRFLPDGTNPYSTYIPTDEEILGAKKLTFGDLSKSMGAVGLEMAAREAIWSHSVGTTALALATDIPGEKMSPRKEKIDRMSEVSKSLPSVLSSRSEKTPRPAPKMQEEVPVMTGREAVQFFAGCHHTGKIKSLYLNIAPNRHYRPYDLISVPKNKVNREHYVFSTFGVLHVYPDQPAENMTLAEWQREAVLWKAASSIPFFKNYLVSKSFYRWSANRQYTEFQRRQRSISRNLLSSLPPFGAALLQISGLLKELLTVPFLPPEIDKTYQLGEYENSINYKNIQAEKLLDRFFRYCKMVVDFTAEEAFKRLRYCEDQIKKKTVFSKDSLHMQKMKKQEREQNLKDAKRETAFLGNFVKLVDQMIVEHMFQITKSQATHFVHSVLEIGMDAPREGFFKANLVFNKQDMLGLSPSKDRFQKVLSNTLRGIPQILMSKVIAIDGCVQDKESLEGDTTARSEGHKHPDNIHRLSISFAQATVEGKSGTASLISSLKQSSHQTFGTGSEPPASHLEGTSGDRDVDGETVVSSVKVTGDGPLPLPDLPKQATPSKEEDEMGVATPELVMLHADDGQLVVEGEGFMGQYSPLSKANLEEKLHLDHEYQAALKKQMTLMAVSMEEIDHYCELNKWLNEIHQYCRRWNEKSVKEFRGAAAFAIEQKLTELRQWSEKVRNFDRNYVTENGMFYIDCSAIHEGLLPRLNDIYQELITFVADEAKSLAKNFAEEMNVILKNMTDKREDVSSFASFAKNFGHYKKNTVQYQQRVEYIKSLYEVIRMSYRQLTNEEEKHEERVWSSWEAFLMQMQDASEFVNIQTPLMMQQLEEAFQRLRKEATMQSELATTGMFLDPTVNALKILADMKVIREKFFSTQTQLQEASQWREAILGEPYSLKFLNEMIMKMDVRQELWKYVEVSTHTIKDWKQMLFKKINIKKALEKVIEWQSAASQLKPLVGHGDSVLTAWYRQLQDFRKDLPILHKLANDALRERHWHAIFLGLNEPFDPSHQFTVAELMSYNLSDHAELVTATYLSALAEYDLEQRLNRITKFWHDRQFKLAKHIPDSMFTKEPAKRGGSGKRPTKLERYRQERAAAMAGAQKGLEVANDDFYVLIEVEDLKYLLEDARCTVDAMLASPYVGDIKSQVEYWCQALREIEEIADQWVECQKKWLYLLKIFERAELYRKFSQQAFKFEAIHTKFKDWMRVVSNDSKCLSVVNRRRGDKGYRLLQGDNLKALLLSLTREQEEILRDLEAYIERSRSNFPRLYFLSNLEIVDLLGVSRNPQALLPYVRKCFPTIQNLTFALPPGMGGLNSQLDFALNSDKLEVVSIHGSCGEELPLYTRVKAMPLATNWLLNINDILKNTMSILMQACVQARMEEGTRQPILILEELARLGGHSASPRVEELSSEIKSRFRHWLLRFPVQCVITAEAVMWERGMTRILEREDKDELRMLRSSHGAKLDQLVDVLQETQTRARINDNDRQRLRLLISGLLNQSIYHRDIMENLIESSQVTDAAFDWLKILKFRMDIRNILRAKTVMTESSANASTGGVQKQARRSSVKAKKDTKVTIEETPKLSRTLTTVSTDYQFSACYIQQLGNVFSYDYEYLGPSSHLVVTPLTERAFLAVGHALKTFHCGTMIGPNGTGKTETVRELAKLLGRCIFTISCHESITLPMMLQYMTGMVQSGCWALFDDTDRLTRGLMSVTAQQLDYLRTALRTLDVNSENQYQIRGHSHFDKVFAMKAGMGDKVIRRNSLTTLHPLPRVEVQPSPLMERQRTVPHGFNEKGLVTYFEDTWVAERDQRRHSIEREIEIKESDLYKSNKPPPLFYEHVKAGRKRSPPDFSKLTAEPSYSHRMLGNVMFNGKLIQASSNFGCFMTLNANNPASSDIPYNFRVLMRPCALIVPDSEKIISVTLQSYGYHKHALWAQKLTLFFKFLETQMPRQKQHQASLREIKRVLMLAVAKKVDTNFLHEISGDAPGVSDGTEWKPSSAESTPEVAEEHSLVFALKEILSPRYESEAETNKFLDLLREVFPRAISEQSNSSYSALNQQVSTAISEVFKEDKMEANDILFDKILQLHKAVDTKTPVILTGQTGSGKTKAYHTLARAINLLNYKQYAPDHSKDELSTERDVLFQTKQKLKELDEENADLLKDMDEDLKPKQSTGIKKLQKLKLNISMAKAVKTTGEGARKVQQDSSEFPKIDLVHLFPGAMTPLELLGTFKDGMWHGGLLGKIARDSYFMWLATKSFIENQKNADKKNVKGPVELPSILQRWLVLDGDLDPVWTEGVKTMLDDEQRLSVGNGEGILLKDSTNVIFETSDLKSAAPSTIARATVVFCGPGTTNWTSLYHTWKLTAPSKWLLTSVGLKILDDLINDVLPSTVKFLSSECQTALLTDVGSSSASANQVTPGVSEISAFLRIFSAMLDRSLNREEMEKKMRWEEEAASMIDPPESKKGDRQVPPSRQMGSRLTNASQIESVIPNYRENLKGMFAFSYIWAFGGHLHDRFRERFSKFAHDALYRASHSIRLPLWGQVFDYYLDESNGTFAKWSDRQQQDRVKNLAGFLVTPEVDRYSCLLELLMASHQPVLLSGSPGVGKTSLVQSMVLAKMPSSSVTMSRGLTASIFQDLLMGHVLDIQSKTNAAVGGPGAGAAPVAQRHLFFVDDLNMAPAVGGYQPPLELIRHILTEGGTYERHRKEFQKTEEAAFIAATTLPAAAGTGLGNACHVMSSRLTRQFVNLTVFTPSGDALLTMFSRPLQTWLEEFPTYSVEHHYEFAKAMSEGMLELYQAVKDRLRPSPAHAHYIFSLHDLARVVQGIMLMSPRTRIKKVKVKKREAEKLGSLRSRNPEVNSAPMMRVIAQLWCHEVSRNFGDRIINADDQAWFSKMVEDVVTRHFCSSRDDVRPEMSAISEEPTMYRKSPPLQRRQFASPPPKIASPCDDDEEEEEEDSGETDKAKTDALMERLNVTSRQEGTGPSSSRASKRNGEEGLSPLDMQSATQASTPRSESRSALTGATSVQTATTEGATHVTSESDSLSESNSQLDKSIVSTTTGGRETELGDIHEAETEYDGEGTEIGDKVTTTQTSDDSDDSDDSDSTSEVSSSSATETYASMSEWAKGSPELLACSSMILEQNPTRENSSAGEFITASASGTPRNKRQGSRAAKRGVTFKAGLIADKEHEAYYGPLVSLDEIKGNNNMLTDLIFSKYFMACHTETHGFPTEKGYMENGEEVLADALQTCLSRYNDGTSQRLELVFFSEAVRHAARLSRVLAHPKGHALLLGMSYCTGRATVARLAAFVGHCKLYEPKPQSASELNLRVVRRHIKLSCFHAGITGKPTVLLVHEDLGEECLQDVSAVMAEGTSPGLYSDEEVQDIVGHMMPGGVQTKRVDKIEQAFERFIKRVRQNLHVIVCLNYKGNSFSTDFHALQDKLHTYPGLIKNCFSIDLYLPWSFRALSQVARAWLEDTKSGVRIPWNPHRKMEQIEMASNTMAYIHLSAKAAIERQFCHQKEPLRIFTPLTFLEFVHIFKIVAAFLVKTEKGKGVKFEQALSKIDEAFGSIAEFKKEVSDLMPRQKSANSEIRDLVTQVETHKQEYIVALDKCKTQEEKIIELQVPLERLRKSAQSEFDKVNPIYEAAAQVLDNLDYACVEELKSYPSPPETVEYVMNAVCLLFNKPQTWDSAKSLMADKSFFQELIFYNKDDIPEDIFNALKRFMVNPLFDPHVVRFASSAASSMCCWVRAVYMYSSIHRKMQPHLKNLLDAENKFTKAQAQLGQLRVEAHRIKNSLEQHINHHKEAVKVAKAIEKQIQAVERRIARANNLMENMSMQHFLWRSELKKTRKQIASAPGDAIITAACVVYHGPLDDKSRLDLIHEWLDRIKHSTLDAQTYMDREPYSVTARLELLMEGGGSQVQGRRNSGDVSEAASGSHATETYRSEVSSNLPSHPQVKTFKYMSAVYDSSKYYKNELKKQDTMESVILEEDVMDDSDDEDDHGPLPTRPNLTLQDILSDFDELSDWRMQNLPTDLHSVQNALMMRVCCHNRKHCWPLLIDPDNQAEMWVKALQNSQNVFTERDVADFAVEDAIPIDERSLQKSSEQDIPEPPPSRGTILTFSDVTEYTFADSQSQYTSTSRAMTSHGWLSRHTGDSDELRPVTSVTNSWDSYNLNAETDLDVPDSSLWVLEADDPNINSRLINAIVHGVTVLVTHLERKPLDPFFRGLLLKQFYVDKEGNKIVKVGDMAFNYHPNFCLYLSTTVPLFVKGDGLYSFPLNRLCVINMAVSDEAIIHRLMFETMKIEKKEFEGQKRSNENDIILHRQRLAREHEIIREKTLNLNGPLLEDKTMLDSLIVCQTNVERNRQILEETRYMGDHLEGKFAHYSPFIKHSVMLYNVLRKMAVLYPCYYLPFYKYVEMFAAVIRSRDRGKGSLGAPQVRAQELSDAVLHTVIKYVKLMMFEQHYNLLCLLVSLERMMRQRKASNKELSLFVNGCLSACKTALSNKHVFCFMYFCLSYLSFLPIIYFFIDFVPTTLLSVFCMKSSLLLSFSQAWLDCSILESLHHPFHGLCHSLVNNSQQWEEYFKHDVSLVNMVPGTTLQELSLFQKCLLWKVICPHKMAELSQAIILYELGSAVDPADNYNIREVFARNDQHTPTVFLLPTSEKGPAWDGTVGYPFMSPAHEVKRLAREVGMEGKVRILNFGVQSQWSEVQHAIEDCLQTGHWLLLQNYHLAENPDPQFFQTLKDLIYARWTEKENADRGEVSDEGRSLVTRSRPSTHVHSNKIHKLFRLWITTRADGKRIIPGLLIQHGLRVTCEATANFRSLLGKAYKSTGFLMSAKAATESEMVQRFHRVMPLALLHALVLQQSYYGRHAFVNHQFWTLADLANAVDVFQNLTAWTTDLESTTDLVAQVYSGHCRDLSDARSVQAVVKDLARYSVHVGEISGKEVKGVGRLLQRLIEGIKETGDLQRALDSIEDISARTFSLPDEAQAHLMTSKSKILIKELTQATGAPELLLSSQLRGGAPSSALAGHILPALLDQLTACPVLPDTSSAQIMPLDVFFSQEVAGFKQLFLIVQNDLKTLSKAAQGEISLTSHMSSIFNDVCNDEVPTAWLGDAFATSPSLRVWLSEMAIRMTYIKDCLLECPAVLHLSMFLRPDRLFRVVMQTYARKNFKDIADVKLDFQVMPEGLTPSMSATSGVFLTGVQLKNATWDTTLNIISDAPPGPHGYGPFPTIWVKPGDVEASTTNKSVPAPAAKNAVYLCPLYSARHSDHHSDANVLWNIPLPSLEHPNIWAQKRVALTLMAV